MVSFLLLLRLVLKKLQYMQNSTIEIIKAEYTVAQVVAASLIHIKQVESSREATEFERTKTTDLTLAITTILDSGITLPLEKAEEMMHYVTNNVTLSILLGRNVTEFTLKLSEAIKDPTRLVPSFKFSFLFWVKRAYDNAVRQDRAREDGYSSDYVGEVGEKLTLSLRISSSRIVQTPDNRYRSFIIPTVAFDENGNMFSFNSKNQLDVTEQYSYHIIAKVKKHEINKYANNAKSTVLFYIKEVK